MYSSTEDGMMSETANIVKKERLRKKTHEARMRRRKKERKKEKSQEADRSCQKRVAARLRAWPHLINLHPSQGSDQELPITWG